MNESKRTIERIEFIEEQKQEIKRIWEGKPPAKLIEMEERRIKIQSRKILYPTVHVG
jgi:hypothetical protein